MKRTSLWALPAIGLLVLAACGVPVHKVVHSEVVDGRNYEVVRSHIEDLNGKESDVYYLIRDGQNEVLCIGANDNNWEITCKQAIVGLASGPQAQPQPSGGLVLPPSPRRLPTPPFSGPPEPPGRD